jgi:hypothetical protein
MVTAGVATLLGLSVALVTASAAADAPAPAPPPAAAGPNAAPQAPAPADAPGEAAAPEAQGRYQGAFWGPQLHLGLTTRLDAGAGEAPGPALGLSLRVATLAELLDLQLTALGSWYQARPPGAEPVDVKRLSVGVEIHLHPLFLRHLQGTWLDLWLAGLYLAAGGDADVTDLDGAGQSRTEVDFGWHLGAGMDVPLTDPRRGPSVWIGLAYRLKFLFVSTGIPGLHDFSEHTLLLTVGYRDPDIFGARVPRPTELDYRAPAHPEEHGPP